MRNRPVGSRIPTYFNNSTNKTNIITINKKITFFTYKYNLPNV